LKTNKQHNFKIPGQQPNLPDTIIRKAHRQDAELLVEIGKRAFIENGIFKLSTGSNLWSEAMSRMTLSSGGICPLY
jgi:hypothetical protein